MLLTPKQAIELAAALIDSARRVGDEEQQQMIVFTRDTCTAVPFADEAAYCPEEDIIVF